ncbi:MAG: enoyl-CoA hydratase-related protein [Pseudomonadota bacterium]
MMSKHILARDSLIAEKRDELGYLILNRPQRKNAITFEMWTAIPEALEWLEQHDTVRCIVIEGAGGVDFSAGADIGEFDTMRGDPSSAQDYEMSNSAAFGAVRKCHIPTVAKLRGICFGGAFGLAAAADIRIASKETTFSVPAGKLGLAYPPDAMPDIVEAIGSQNARAMLYTAQHIGAEEALKLGFVYSLCASEDLEQRVGSFAREICANAPLSNRASKAAIRAALSGNAEDRRHADAIAQSTFLSADYEEGRAAFKDKRPPRFVGK